MCISAMIVGGIISAAGSIFSGFQQAAIAQSNAEWQQYQLDVQNKQLEEEKTMTRLKAQQVEADRIEADRRQRAINVAYLATTGVEDNISFTQGADEYNKDQMKRDVATLRLNSDYQINRISDQIAVNTAQKGYVAGMADMQSTGALVGGFLNAGASLFTAYGKTSYYRV